MAAKIYKYGKEEDWGWNFDGSKYVPIMTDIKPVTKEVLKIILCNCKSSCKTTRCTCRKYGIFCSSICNTCIGNNCDNVNVSYQIDEENLVFDIDQ